MKKVLKKKHVRIRIKAGGSDLPPLENHKFYRFPQICAAVRMSNYEYRIGNLILVVMDVTLGTGNFKPEKNLEFFRLKNPGTQR